MMLVDLRFINYARLHPERISLIVLPNTYYSKTATLKLPELIALNAEPSFKKLAIAIMSDPDQRRWLLSFQANLFLENATPEIQQTVIGLTPIGKSLL